MQPAAVVCNSSILKGCKLGPLIDEFQTVVRINNFKIHERWAMDVGTKTTHWAHYRPYTAHEGEYNHEIVTTNLAENKLWLDGELIRPTNYVKEVVDYGVGVWPTTGIVLLNWLHTVYRPLYLFGWHHPSAMDCWYNFITYYWGHDHRRERADQEGFSGTHHDVHKDRIFIDWLIKKEYAVEIL